jgi:hypothetical protein
VAYVNAHSAHHGPAFDHHYLKGCRQQDPSSFRIFSSNASLPLFVTHQILHLNMARDCSILVQPATSGRVVKPTVHHHQRQISNVDLPHSSASLSVFTLDSSSLTNIWSRCRQLFRWTSSARPNRLMSRSLHELSRGFTISSSASSVSHNRSVSAIDLPDLVLAHTPAITLDQLTNAQEWAQIGHRLRILSNRFERSMIH